MNDTDIILDSITDGVFTIDSDWKITSFNAAAEDITGIPRDEAVGQPCSYVFKASICEAGCALKHTMKTGRPVRNKPIYIIRADGGKVPVSISTALLRNAAGNIIGGVETFRDLRVEEELKRELENRYSFADIISRNHHMREILDRLPIIAESPATVLVTGESGTGKELVCKALHQLSPRKNGPFVTVNCGALPDTLLESELFGYKAGAFTDARHDKKGRFALAKGGVILLDEIGDISPALQVRLLRLLQEKTFEPLGSETQEKADVRILAATNRDLGQLVREGLFRSDLYYRINVVKIAIPPLRERKDDIPLLVEHFIKRFNTLHERRIEGVSEAVTAALMAHDYPGNIRELENAIEHAFVLCTGDRILPRHLPEQFAIEKKPDRIGIEGKTLRELEIAALTDALERNGYNRTAAATELGIHKTTLHRKIRDYSLILPNSDGRTSQRK